MLACVHVVYSFHYTLDIESWYILLWLKHILVEICCNISVSPFITVFSKHLNEPPDIDCEHVLYIAMLGLKRNLGSLLSSKACISH